MKWNGIISGSRGYLNGMPGACGLLVALAFLAGCKGVSQPGEREARRQAQTVAAQFRPDGYRPDLPQLTTNSSLGDFLHYAMLNRPAVGAAYFDWLASIERITIERSLPDPQLTFEADISSTVMTVMPGLMQEFPAPGKLKAAGHIATAGSEAKYFAFESAVLEAALEVKRAAFELHYLNEKIRINRETLVLLKDLELIARAQNDAGKVTLQDVYRAQIEQDQLATELANLEDSRHPMLARLKAALGLKPAEPDPPAPAALDSTPLDLNAEALLAAAFARNPRLKAMEADVRMAEADIALARKSKLPDFSLGLEADVKQSPVMFRPQAAVTLPIWRDKIAAQIARAQASKQAAEARLDAAQIELTVDFAMKTFDYREATRNLTLLQNQLLPKAGQSLQIARTGYLSDQIDFFNLIDAERTQLNFQLAEVEATARREIVLAELSLLIAGVPPAGAPLLPASQSSKK